MLAPDPDGKEAITWHLKHALKLDDEECRIEFNEITKRLFNAIEDPRTIDYQRVDAQQARRVLDRLRLQAESCWKKVKRSQCWKFNRLL